MWARCTNVNDITHILYEDKLNKYAWSVFEEDHDNDELHPTNKEHYRVESLPKCKVSNAEGETSKPDLCLILIQRFSLSVQNHSIDKR